jgi:hypothetical protein
VVVFLAVGILVFVLGRGVVLGLLSGGWVVLWLGQPCAVVRF